MCPDIPWVSLVTVEVDTRTSRRPLADWRLSWAGGGTGPWPEPSPAHHLLIWPLNRWPATPRIGYISPYLSGSSARTSSPNIVRHKSVIHSYDSCSFHVQFYYEGEDSESLSGLKVQLKVSGPKSIFVHLLVWALFLVVGWGSSDCAIV